MIVGPNNCGKTTVLQAISLWAEAWRHWIDDENASGWLREDDRAAVRTSDNSYVTTTVDAIRSVSVSDFADLWHNKDVQEPVVLEMHTMAWHVALELHFRTSATIAVRPGDAVPAKELRRCMRGPLVPVYISSTLRLDDDEAMLDDDVLPIRLSSGRGASILRNMLLRLSDDAWDTLVNSIQSLFGYEVNRVSRGDPLRVYYRHSTSDIQLEIACAGSGFLQVLLLFSSLLYGRANIVLVDEPDMHLHRLLQNEVYGQLDRISGSSVGNSNHDQARHSHKERDQLIVSTHSDVLVDKVDLDRLRSVTNTGLLEVQHMSALKDALDVVTNSAIHTALAIGRILYVEGDTDVPILRAWAKALGHPVLSFLGKPFVVQTAEKKKKRGEFAKMHYRALRSVVPSLLGIELRDRNSKDISQSARDEAMQSTPPRTYWHRYEIENYLLHPDAILRVVMQRGGNEAKTRAKAFIERNWPRVVIDDPRADNQFLDNTKGKDLIAKVMESAGLPWMDRESVEIAEEMTAAEVHPEVRRKLDEIAAHLAVDDDNSG